MLKKLTVNETQEVLGGMPLDYEGSSSASNPYEGKQCICLDRGDYTYTVVGDNIVGSAVFDISDNRVVSGSFSGGDYFWQYNNNSDTHADGMINACPEGTVTPPSSNFNVTFVP